MYPPLFAYIGKMTIFPFPFSFLLFKIRKSYASTKNEVASFCDSQACNNAALSTHFAAL